MFSTFFSIVSPIFRRLDALLAPTRAAFFGLAGSAASSSSLSVALRPESVTVGRVGRVAGDRGQGDMGAGQGRVREGPRGCREAAEQGVQ